MPNWKKTWWEDGVFFEQDIPDDEIYIKPIRPRPWQEGIESLPNGFIRRETMTREQLLAKFLRPKS